MRIAGVARVETERSGLTRGVTLICVKPLERAALSPPFADQRAFAGAVSQHRSALTAQALRLTKNRSDAEDLLQEMLLRAWGVLLCAAAGGLFGAAGALLEDLSSTKLIFLGVVWQGGMGVVLAVIADLLLARSSADTPAAENA